jgi:hypothetical protein
MNGGDWQRVHNALTRLARTRGALDAEEATWLIEAVRVRVYEALACGSLLEYLERVLGYGPRLAKERLRVAEALSRLPALHAALASGELPWSAVREISRVATASTESEWTAAARGKTVRQVEEMVSGRRSGDRPGDPADPSLKRHVLRLEISADALAAFRDARRYLELEVGHSLEDDEMVRMLAHCALDSERDPGRAAYQVAMTVCTECRRGTRDGAGQVFAVETEQVDAALCDAQQVFIDISEAGIDARDEGQVGPLPGQGSLPSQVDSWPGQVGPFSGSVDPLPGHGPLPAHVDPLPGQSPLPAHVDPLPGQGPLPAQADPVSGQGPLPAQADPVSGQGPLPAQADPLPGHGPVPAQVDPLPAQGPLPAQVDPLPAQVGPLPGQVGPVGPLPAQVDPLPGQGSLPGSVGPLPSHVGHAAASACSSSCGATCSAPIVPAAPTIPSHVGHAASACSSSCGAACSSPIVPAATQTIPPRIRRLVWRRDHGRCTVPGCRAARYLEIHHLVPLSEGGNHDPSRLLLLCSAHHGRVHDGRLRIGGMAPNRLMFTHANGAPFGAIWAVDAESEGGVRRGMEADAVDAVRRTGVSLADARRAVAEAARSQPAAIEELIRRTFAVLGRTVYASRMSERRAGYSVRGSRTRVHSLERMRRPLGEIGRRSAPGRGGYRYGAEVGAG